MTEILIFYLKFISTMQKLYIHTYDMHEKLLLLCLYFCNISQSSDSQMALNSMKVHVYMCVCMSERVRETVYEGLR